MMKLISETKRYSALGQVDEQGRLVLKGKTDHFSPDIAQRSRTY